MSASQLRFAKSETRDLADRDRLVLPARFGTTIPWGMSDATFFTTFVAIMAVLTVVALVLR